MKRIKSLLPQPLRRLLRWAKYCVTWDPWQNCSWSQEGEDLLLDRIFTNKKSGFYIDIGAHHPKRFSNTFLFYKKGWFGINVDAMPGSMRAFKQTRPRDINVEMGIGLNEDELEYYLFNEPALNGFSKSLSQHRDADASQYKIIKIRKVKVLPLVSLLEKFLPHKQQIDFMNVDVEGMDLDVLKSNNWEQYRPKCLLVEVLESTLHEINRSEIGSFMNTCDYSIYAKCMNTVFFKDNRAPAE